MKEFYTKYDYWRSQSALKDFEKPNTCPVRWKHTNLTKLIKFTPSKEMQYGLYFEGLVLGGSAYDEENHKFPGKDSSVIKQRIDYQVDRTKEILFSGLEDYHIDVQYPISIESSRDHGTIDLLSVDLKNGKDVKIVDLKLTENCNTMYGPFPWGNPSELDYTQQTYYQDILEQSGYNVIKNQLVIVDYSTDQNISIIDIDISDESKQDVRRRFSDMDERIEEFEKDGWDFNPSYEECKKCGLDKCPVRIDKKPIKHYEVQI